MSEKFLAENLRSIANTLGRIYEADEPKNTAVDPLSTSANKPSVGSPAADIAADANVNDMMTHEKKPVKLQGSIAVKDLAKTLGIQNTALFSAAFNALKSGKLPNNQSQIRELAIAFGLLLAADASTTTRVLNQFRRIHKAS